MYAIPLSIVCTLFFSNDPATTDIYTLPYTTLFRSQSRKLHGGHILAALGSNNRYVRNSIGGVHLDVRSGTRRGRAVRLEEHTSELQSLRHLVCRLLLEKKKKLN